MSSLKNMPAGGVVVIAVILALFALSLILLVYIQVRYRALSRRAQGDGADEDGRGFRALLLDEFSAAYRKSGSEVNTPAIIADAMGRRLGGLLLLALWLIRADRRVYPKLYGSGDAEREE